MTIKSRTSLLTTARYLDVLDTTKLAFVGAVMLLVAQTSVVLIQFVRNDFSIAFSGSESYGQIAENIVNSGLYSLDGHHPTAFRPPLYPLYLTPFIALFGDSFRWVAAVSQSVLDIGCGVLMFFISLRIFKSNLGAFISVLMYVLHYTFHVESIHQRETILFTFLLVLFFYLITGKRSIVIYSVLSCVAALSYLTKSTGIFLFPLIL